MFSRLIVVAFKAVGDLVEIDLRPITFLFSPDAAGKSSVLDAVHHLAELLRGGPRDVYKFMFYIGPRTLGGFDNVVHGRDPVGRVTLGRAESQPGGHPGFVAGVRLAQPVRAGLPRRGRVRSSVGPELDG